MAARRVGPGEALEDPGQHIGCDAGTVIDDHQAGLTVPDAGYSGDGGARGGVVTGVGQQVDDHLVEAVGVGPNLEPFLGKFQAPGVIGSGGARVADGVEHHRDDVDGLHLDGGVGVEPGQQEKILDEFRHALRLRVDPAQRERRVRAVAAGRQLRVTADGGQGIAQLVGGVGDETPQLGLGGLPDFEGSLHVAEHPVEGAGQLRHLVFGGQRRIRDSGHVDLPAVQVQLRDRRCRRRQRPQRFRCGIGDGAGRERSRHHGCRTQGDGQQTQAHDGGVDGLQRQGQHHQFAVAVVLCDRPVLAQIGDVHGVFLTVRVDLQQGVDGFRGDVVVLAVPDLRSDTDAARSAQHHDGTGWCAGRQDALRAAVLLAGFAHLEGCGVVHLFVELLVHDDARCDDGSCRDQQRQHRHHDRDAPPQLGGEAGRAHQELAGRSTYPAPRMVWIIGERPASIFLRR